MSASGTSDRPAARATPRELRQFARTVGGAFVVLAAVGAWRHRAVPAVAFGVAGVLLAAAGVIAPGRLGPLFRAWMGLAHVISRVTTPIVLGLVYFGVFTPFGLVMRLAGRRPLARPRGAASFWVERAPEARRSDLHRQF